MTLQNRWCCAFTLSDTMVKVLDDAMSEIPEGKDVVLNFRDPDYSAVDGGFHPVEIRINETGEIEYITDFSYVGLPPFGELAKEIDFDFLNGELFHFNRTYPIATGADLFEVWQSNFTYFVGMGVFKKSVTIE